MSRTRVVLIEVDPSRTAETRALLVAAGCELVATLAMDGGHLHKILPRTQADLVVLSPRSPADGLLEGLEAIQSLLPVPIVMFSADDDTHTVERAVQAGVSAYVVDGAGPDRLRPILVAARARYAQLQELSEALNKARIQLSDRKMIERAKGIIMAERGVSEDQAYQMMRKTAMDRNKRLADIAQTIVAASELLGAGMVPQEPAAVSV